VTHLTAAQATSNQRQRYGGRSAFGILDSGRSAIRDSAGFLRGSGFGVHAPRAPTDGCPHSPFVPAHAARRAAGRGGHGGGWLAVLATLLAVCCVLLALLGSPWATPVVAWARSWQCKSNGVGVDVHVSRRRPTPAPPTPGRLRLRLHEPKVGWGRCISAGTSPMQGNRPRHQPLPDRRVVMFLACCSVLAVP
jgi:hypothetical protein